MNGEKGLYRKNTVKVKKDFWQLISNVEREESRITLQLKAWVDGYALKNSRKVGTGESIMFYYFIYFLLGQKS